MNRPIRLSVRGAIAPKRRHPMRLAAPLALAVARGLPGAPARATPGSPTCGSPGNGSSGRLSTERLTADAKVD